jgi:ATP-dependent helicase YprA (DUF1998 family)
MRYEKASREKTTPEPNRLIVRRKQNGERGVKLSKDCWDPSRTGNVCSQVKCQRNTGGQIQTICYTVCGCTEFNLVIANGSTEGTNEKLPFGDPRDQFAHISVSFAGIDMKHS